MGTEDRPANDGRPSGWTPVCEVTTSRIVVLVGDGSTSAT